MITVGVIAARLAKLVREPPVRRVGIAAATRAMQRTNSQLAQAGAPHRVSLQSGTDRVHFTVSAPSGAKPFTGQTPMDLLRRNLETELTAARAQVATETKRVLSG